MVCHHLFFEGSLCKKANIEEIDHLHDEATTSSVIDETMDDGSYTPPFSELLSLVDGNRYDKRLTAILLEYESLLEKGTPDEDIKNWYADKKIKLGPQLVGYKECLKTMLLYRVPANSFIRRQRGAVISSVVSDSYQTGCNK